MVKYTAVLDKEKITELYTSGSTTEQISKVFGVTPSTIRKFMRKHDIELRKSRSLLTEEQKEQAVTMRSSGMTLKQITVTFNVDYTCIHNSLINGEKKENCIFRGDC
jgi:DNA invertase Pin-like site-specific DNA recombinase